MTNFNFFNWMMDTICHFDGEFANQTTLRENRFCAATVLVKPECVSNLRIRLFPEKIAFVLVLLKPEGAFTNYVDKTR